MNDRTFYKAFNKDVLDSADLERQHTEIQVSTIRRADISKTKGTTPPILYKVPEV